MTGRLHKDICYGVTVYILSKYIVLIQFVLGELSKGLVTLVKKSRCAQTLPTAGCPDFCVHEDLELFLAVLYHGFVRRRGVTTGFLLRPVPLHAEEPIRWTLRSNHGTYDVSLGMTGNCQVGQGSAPAGTVNPLNCRTMPRLRANVLSLLG